jgi:hypothetical protein
VTAVQIAPQRGRTWVKVVLAVLLLCVAAMWVYYFFFASDRGVYQLDDKNWRLQAAPICQAAQAERNQLADTSGGFIQHPTTAQMAQRADIADKATDILEKMVNDIVAIPVATERDRELLTVFKQQYDLVIADRRRYAASLRKGEYVNYTETVSAGGPVSNVVLDFTAGVKGNDVPDCSPPGELGGEISP